MQKDIEAFYGRYASSEGITMADARKRASKLDMEEYSRKAEKYVAEKDFSTQANEEMRLYNLTMKVNRLELLKAEIGLELVAMTDDVEKLLEKGLDERTIEEFKRQAGILGMSVGNPKTAAKSIVNASFHNATFSERIWANQTVLKSEISKLLQKGMIQGRNPKELARELRKTCASSKYDSERLMRTEMARVQIEAQKLSYEENGYDEYEYICCHKGDACSACKALDGEHFKVKDMMPGENAPPMHPNCHCSTSAWLDEEKYNEWLDSYSEYGLSFRDWQERNNARAKAFNTKDDPIREYIGAAEKSHPQELNKIIDDMEQSGVEITRREGVMGYFPGLSVGKAGNVNIEEGASISAWMHEYKHFCDDRADGYLGFRVFQDYEKCIDREVGAYQVEIDFAKEQGYNDIVRRLEKLRDKEVERYE